MDGMETKANAITLQNVNKDIKSDEIASFGAVHLNTTSVEKAIKFWTQIIGMKLRSKFDLKAEFGTAHHSLVVVHQTASSAFREGYSGLYHFAIHLSSKQELAKAIYRLQLNNYPFSPIDHTMTQSLYLTDYDNVMIELAWETPERFNRIITERGLFMEDKEGTVRAASAPLDTEEILKSLAEKDFSKIIDEKAKIGHIHFYAVNVARSNEFYKKMGFSQFNYFPQYKYADLGAGGSYQHRLAMNSWHGNDKPLAPLSNAGLNFYHIVFKSKEQLQKVISEIENMEDEEGNYWTTDPTGVKILLTYDL